MRRLVVGLAVIAWGTVAHAGTFTPQEIERAGRLAQPRINGLVKQLASDRVEGRDNDSPGSQLAQQYILAWLKRYTVGLNGAASGDDAYKHRSSRTTSAAPISSTPRQRAAGGIRHRRRAL
jgi:hypothetical protein